MFFMLFTVYCGSLIQTNSRYNYFEWANGCIFDRSFCQLIATDFVAYHLNGHPSGYYKMKQDTILSADPKDNESQYQDNASLYHDAR